MFPYFLNAVFVPVMLLVSQVQGNVSSARRQATRPLVIFEWMAVVVLTLFTGTRVGIGTDYYLYERIYAGVNSNSWAETIQSSPHEFGFVVLQLAVKSLGMDFRAFTFVCSALTTLAIWAALKVMDTNVAQAMFVYATTSVFLDSMNIVRQAMAAALVFLAAAILPRSRLAAAVLATLAISVHSSAVVATLILLLLRRFTVGILGAFLAGGVGLLGATLVATIPGLYGLAELLNERYADYLVSGQTGGLGTYLVGVLYLVVVSLLSRVTHLSREQKWWRNAVMLAPGLVLLGTTVPIAGRLSEFFTIFFVPLIPVAIRETRHRLLWGATGVLAGFGYLALHVSNYNGLLPYRSWLFGGA